MLYGAATTTDDGQTRTCVRASGGALHLGYCDVLTDRRKWLLDESGQIRMQTDPGQCWQVPDALRSSDSVDTAACETSPNDHQVFVFNPDGTITSPAAADECLSSATLAFQTCTHPESGTALRFEIEASPTSLFELQSPTTYFSALHIASSYYTASSDGSLALTLQPNATGGYWFMSPVPGSPGQVYIQSYPSGDCLTELGAWQKPYVRRCETLGHDALQRWQIPTTSSLVAAADGDCLMYDLPARSSPFNDVTPTPSTAPCSAVPSSQTTVATPDSGARLNVTLVAENPTTHLPVCVTPSVSDRSIQAGDCSNKATAYQSTVDVLPNSTIHFQATGNCLDEYLSGTSGMAAQWPCNFQPNQAWTATSVTSGITSPVGKFVNQYDQRSLTPTPLENGLQVSSSPSATTSWALQSTSNLMACLGAVANRRVPRTPEGDVLAGELGYVLDAVANLPQLEQYPELLAAASNLRAIQAALRNGSTFSAERGFLRQYLYDLGVELDAYRAALMYGSLQNQPVSTHRTVTYIGAIITNLFDAVVEANTDADLSTRLWDCPVAPWSTDL